MNYEACTICGNPVDPTRHQTSRTGGNVKEGLAHEVCHLRHIANVRLDKIEELRDKVQELEDELWARDNPYKRHPWVTDVEPHKPARGLIGRALYWLLWEC
jgi:hypothetical protein